LTTFSEKLLRPGGILAFSGFNPTSDIINLGTWGIPRLSVSHVGIIGRYCNENVLFESTTLNDIPCLIQGKPVHGTQAHRVADRLATYVGRVWYFPLYRELYEHEEQRLSQFLIADIGKSYDLQGALWAGGLGLLDYLIFKPDYHALFCSEWVASAHAAIGILQTADGSRWNPNYLTRYEHNSGILKDCLRFK
jgi:hypothetical protein